MDSGATPGPGMRHSDAGHAECGAGLRGSQPSDSSRGRSEFRPLRGPGSAEGTPMQELRLVAVSEDGSYAILAVPGRGGRFSLPIDDRLRTVARGQFSRLAQYEIEVENPLRPKEIQDRIRSGETADEIADLAGIPIERVRRFEGPVLAEREYRSQEAQRATVRSAGDSGPGPRLSEIVAERLAQAGASAEDARWDSRKRADGNWQVQLMFTAGGRPQLAEWIFDPQRRHVTPDDDQAAKLSLSEAELAALRLAPRGPGSATVTPIARRIGAQSQEPHPEQDGPPGRAAAPSAEQAVHVAQLAATEQGEPERAASRQDVAPGRQDVAASRQDLAAGRQDLAAGRQDVGQAGRRGIQAGRSRPPGRTSRRAGRTPPPGRTAPPGRVTRTARPASVRSRRRPVADRGERQSRPGTRSCSATPGSPTDRRRITHRGLSDGQGDAVWAGVTARGARPPAAQPPAAQPPAAQPPAAQPPAAQPPAAQPPAAQPPAAQPVSSPSCRLSAAARWSATRRYC